MPGTGTQQQQMMQSISAAGFATDFHSVRVSERVRAQAINERGATQEQTSTSYFVPSLQSICASLLAQNFSTMRQVDELQQTHPQLHKMVLDKLPTGETDLPLSMSVSRVVSESYWKACCMSRWSLGQVAKFAKETLVDKEYGWKRLYLEHVLADFLMSLRGNGKAMSSMEKGDHPSTRRNNADTVMTRMGFTAGVPIDEFSHAITDEDAQALTELCAVCRDYVHTIELPCMYTRLRWYEHLFSKLPGILTFRLTYGASNAGVGYDPCMIGFSEEDADDMRYFLRRYAPLESLSLPSNRIKGSHCMAICSGLVGNTTLRVLSLSHNSIDDVGVVDGLALLISQPAFPLEELHLDDNNIRGAGAKALAEALEVNKTLLVLNLNQNRIPDKDGADLIVGALAHHPTLKELHLGSNCLASHTAKALYDTLPFLTTLQSLNLSGNRLLGNQRAARSVGDLGAIPTVEDVVGTSSSSIAAAFGKQQQQTTTTGSSSSSAGHNMSSNNITAGNSSNHLNTAPSSRRRIDDVMGDESSAPGDNNNNNGYLVTEAVTRNESLEFLDVRYCNFTTDEICAMESAVEGRVQRMRTAEVVAKEEKRHTDIQQLVSERIRRQL